MRTIFKSINSRKDKIYSHTSEYEFFAENYRLISKILSNYKLRSYDEKTFKIIQVNILIKAMINKSIIEDYVNKVSSFNKKELWDLLVNKERPYFESEGSKIYVPIYSKGLNYIYYDTPHKLLGYPYDELKDDPSSSCIDLFDMYNLNLYNSSFTNLIKIKDDKTSSAFYHPEFETIYIINKQGRLDISIRLFDKYLKTREYQNFNDRLLEVITNFYNNDRSLFIKSLYINKFISFKMYKKLLKKTTIKNIFKNKVGE